MGRRHVCGRAGPNVRWRGVGAEGLGAGGGKRGAAFGRLLVEDRRGGPHVRFQARGPWAGAWG
eukprot:5995250-Lingulodinium_polyedra.AAC.1